MRNQTILVDINKETCKILKYKQYDNNNILQIIVEENYKKINLNEYVGFAFFELPSGLIIKKGCEIEDNVITIIIDNNVLSEEGKVLLDLTLSDGEDIFTLFRINLVIEETIDRDEAIIIEAGWDIVAEIAKFDKAEEQRVVNEERRVDYESVRIANEADRQNEEMKRIANENVRVVKESERLINELGRVDAEEQRIENEELRRVEENERLINELGRVEAENIRAEFYEGFNSELESVNSQLADIENSYKRIIKPEHFGAKGDGFTDDYEAIKKCFTYKDNVIIEFSPKTTYIVSKAHIVCEKHNIQVVGNGSTIKLQDNNTILEDLYYGVGMPEITNLLFKFEGDNISISNLCFDANTDNTYLKLENSKYYGWQPDLGSLGGATDFIFTRCIELNGSNSKISNCIFDGWGQTVAIGDKNWTDYKIDPRTTNIIIENCEFRNGFRDQITSRIIKDFKILNNIFIDNQRKAIQCYRNAHNGVIEGNDIKINTNNIRTWYPSWSITNADAELSGIAITNPGWTDMCENIKIINNEIDTYKKGIMVRNFSKDIYILNNTINSNTCISIEKGINNSIYIENNIFNQQQTGIDYYFATLNGVDTSSICADYFIKNNFFKGNGTVYYLTHENTTTHSCKKVNIISENNIYSNNIYVYLWGAIGDEGKTITKYVNIIDNEKVTTTNDYYYINIKRKYDLPSEVYEVETQSRSNVSPQNNLCKFLEITASKIGRINIEGSINQASGEDLSYCNFRVGLRIENLSGVYQTSLKTFNCDYTDKKYEIVVATNNDNPNKIGVYLKTEILNGRTRINFKAYDSEKSYIYTPMDSNSWLSDTEEKGSIFTSTQI